MSVIRMSPEFVATTFREGDEFRVLEGGAPPGSKVVRAWVEVAGGGRHNPTAIEGADGALRICIEVEDGFDGVRDIVFERLAPR